MPTMEKDLVNVGYADGANRSKPRKPDNKEYMEGYTLGYDSTLSLEDDYGVEYPDGNGGVSKGTQLKLKV